VTLQDLPVAIRLVLHQIGRRRGEGVDLLVQRLVVAALRVLEQGDEQEGEDGGQRVDHELPCVDVVKDEDRRHPDGDDDDGDREEDALAHELRNALREAVEGVTVRLARDPDLRPLAAHRPVSGSIGVSRGHSLHGYLVPRGGKHMHAAVAPG
jgi:hypothetical protein